MNEREKKYLHREFLDLMGMTEGEYNCFRKKNNEKDRNREDLIASLRKKGERCRKCELGAARLNLVFGEGSVHAGLMFIGEAPGADEDSSGRPFVGRAGKKLTEMIENPRSIGVPRKSVYICNILKCRPPGNRNPKPEEVRSCTPFLLEQIKIIQPRVICALGTFAAQWLMNTRTPISLLRGQTGYFQNIPVIPTFHPSYIIRNGNDKKIRKQAWEDMLRVKEVLTETNDRG